MLKLWVNSADGKFVAYGSSDYTVGILDGRTLAVSSIELDILGIC